MTLTHVFRGLAAAACSIAALAVWSTAAHAQVNPAWPKNLTLGTGIAPFALPAFALHRLLGHRGLLHSLLGLVLTGLIVGIPIALNLEPEAAIALLLGYASHLALDGVTKSGIPLWFPNRRRVHLLPPKLRITTGSEPEDIVLALLAMTAIAVLLASLQPPTV